MTDALIGTVVHIHKQLSPVVAKGSSINGITMILRGYITTVGTNLTNRLIVGAMTVFQFIDSGSSCFGQQLATHADTTDRFA